MHPNVTLKNHAPYNRKLWHVMVLNLRNQLEFYFICLGNLKQKKIKIKLVCKI